MSSACSFQGSIHWTTHSSNAQYNKASQVALALESLSRFSSYITMFLSLLLPSLTELACFHLYYSLLFLPQVVTLILTLQSQETPWLFQMFLDNISFFEISTLMPFSPLLLSLLFSLPSFLSLFSLHAMPVCYAFLIIVSYYALLFSFFMRLFSLFADTIPLYFHRRRLARFFTFSPFAFLLRHAAIFAIMSTSLFTRLHRAVVFFFISSYAILFYFTYCRHYYIFADICLCRGAFVAMPLFHYYRRFDTALAFCYMLRFLHYCFRSHIYERHRFHITSLHLSP